MAETLTVNGIIYTRTPDGWRWFDDRVRCAYTSAGAATHTLNALSSLTNERDALLDEVIALRPYVQVAKDAVNATTDATRPEVAVAHWIAKHDVLQAHLATLERLNFRPACCVPGCGEFGWHIVELRVDLETSAMICSTHWGDTDAMAAAVAAARAAAAYAAALDAGASRKAAEEAATLMVSRVAAIPSVYLPDTVPTAAATLTPETTP